MHCADAMDKGWFPGMPGIKSPWQDIWPIDKGVHMGTGIPGTPVVSAIGDHWLVCHDGHALTRRRLAGNKLPVHFWYVLCLCLPASGDITVMMFSPACILQQVDCGKMSVKDSVNWFSLLLREYYGDQYGAGRL